MAIVRKSPGSGCEHGPGCPHDIGVAAAGVDGTNAREAMAAVDAVRLEAQQSVGAGPVEKRQETLAERAAREARDIVRSALEPRPARAGIPMHIPRTVATQQLIKGAGGPAQPGDRVHRGLPTPPASEPAPVPASRAAQDAPPVSMGSGLVVPAPARPVVPDPDPIEHHQEEPVMAIAEPARPALPCATCLHDPVCALKERLSLYSGTEGEPSESVTEVAPGLRVVDVMRLDRIECDHQLVSLRAVEPEPIRREYPGEAWRERMPAEEHVPAPEPITAERQATKEALDEAFAKPKPDGPTPAQQAARIARQRITDAQVIELVRTNNGNLEAVARVAKLSGQAIRARVRTMRDGDMLPADVVELLDGRKRKAAVPA